MLFVLVFARLSVTGLQVVLSFHGLRNQTEAVRLYSAIFVISIGKIAASHKVTVVQSSGIGGLVPQNRSECVRGRWVV